MRTTVRLDKSLMEQARREAERRGQTLTSLIEMGLQLVLAQSSPEHRKKRVTLPVSRVGGGLLPGVDLSNNAALWEIMEGRR